MVDAERLSALLEAVNELRDEEREVVACRYFLELSEEETAETLGLRKGTVNRGSRAALRTFANGWRSTMSERELALERLGRELDYSETPISSGPCADGLRKNVDLSPGAARC